MRDAAREAVDLLGDRTAEQVRQNRTLALSLVKLIEIVGEAATNVSPSRREGTPEIPWADIIGIRNRLIHGYHDVNIAIVVETVRRDLPRLIDALLRLIE